MTVAILLSIYLAVGILVARGIRALYPDLFNDEDLTRAGNVYITVCLVLIWPAVFVSGAVAGVAKAVYWLAGGR